MNTPDDTESSHSKTSWICAFAFALVGWIAFESYGPGQLPVSRGRGVDLGRAWTVASVGAICAAVGSGVGKLIDRMRRRDS